MAWVVKYDMEIADLNGIVWKVEIEEDAFAGTKTTLKGTDNPIRFEYDNNSDDVFDPIHASSVIISVYSETNFSLIDLYSTEDLQYRVKVYQSASLYWQGYIITGNYSEPYEDVPYPVSIVASCGLNHLKNVLYDDSGTYYNGRRIESQIFIDILGKIGYTGFSEYINIYEESMADSFDDSPVDQTRIDVDIFKDMYCYEVLNELLKKYNACIVHKIGGFVIYRPVELTGATVYGRVFTAVSTKSSTSFTSVSYINRPTHTSVLRQVPGGALMVQRPAKKVTVSQDYGYKESWLDNYELKVENYDSATLTYDLWDNDDDLYPFSEEVAGESAGVMLPAQVDAPPNTNYISQTIGVHAITSSDLFAFEFDYKFNNYLGSQITTVLLRVQIKSDISDYYLKIKDEEYLEWDDTLVGIPLQQGWIDISNLTLEKGISEWIHFKRSIEGVPVDGPYTITIWGAWVSGTDSFYTVIKNVKFYTSSSNTLEKKVKRKLRQRIQGGYGGEFYLLSKYYTVKYKVADDTIVENQYIKTNAINGVDLDYDYMIGDVIDPDIDNIIEQFAGSLVSALPTLTAVAAQFVTDHAADYVGGGVVITSSGADIIMTSSTAGTDFTGSTTITNGSGDLDGSVDATQANVTALAEIHTITLSGGSGTADLTGYGVQVGTTHEATYNGSLSQTAADFVTDYAADYATKGIILTSSGNDVIFTASIPGTPFWDDATIVNTSGDLSGSVVITQNNRVAVKRIDTITLTGTYGSADILCDGVTEEATFGLDYTTDWNTRSPGGESKPLLEIIGDEIANQYSRPKQLVQMIIRNTGSAVSGFNQIAHFEDDLNKISGNNRKFVMNRGSFDVKNRIWDVDLAEII